MTRIVGIGSALDQPYWYWAAESAKANQWHWAYAAKAGCASRMKWEPTHQIIAYQHAMAARTL